ALAPQLITIAHGDQLRGDSQTIAGLAHAAFEHVRHAQLLADALNILPLALERERRRARRDAQAGDVAERRDELFRHAVAEVLLILLRTEVEKRKHGDRSRRSGP